MSAKAVDMWAEVEAVVLRLREALDAEDAASTAIDRAEKALAKAKKRFSDAEDEALLAHGEFVDVTYTALIDREPFL